MRPLPLALALTAALAALSAHAAPFTYHGELMDGESPAEGTYDLRVRALASPKARAALGEATELPNVNVTDGRLALDFDLPDNPLGETFIEVAIRKGGSSDKYETLGTPQAVSKVNTGCWALDGNSGAPVGSFLGHADGRTVFVNSPSGVAINSSGELGTNSIDLLVKTKSSGSDSDSDLRLESRSGSSATMFVNNTTSNLVLRSGSGRIEAFGGFSSAQQNDGRSVFDIDGRIRSLAVGTAPGDLGGGLWFDGAAPDASFVGRNLNQEAYTGIYAGNAWRFSVADNGQTTVGGAPLPFVFPLNRADLVVRSQFTASAQVGFVTSSGKQGYLSVNDTSGGWSLDAINVVPGDNFLSAQNGASLSGGGVWTNASSRELKEAFAAVDAGDILARVLALPITSWRYKRSDEGRHLGPMAEDFKQTFDLAGDGKSIGTVDADGVALAAIQGLNAKLERENATLRAQLDAVLARLSRLESRTER